MLWYVQFKTLESLNEKSLYHLSTTCMQENLLFLVSHMFECGNMTKITWKLVFLFPFNNHVSFKFCLKVVFELTRVSKALAGKLAICDCTYLIINTTENINARII